MFSKYKWFFDLYLRTCKGMYNPEKPYDNLEKCIQFCQSSSWELLGMLRLLNKIGEITDEVYNEEADKVSEAFSSIAICNAYMEEGQVMVFESKK